MYISAVQKQKECRGCPLVPSSAIRHSMWQNGRRRRDIFGRPGNALPESTYPCPSIGFLAQGDLMLTTVVHHTQTQKPWGSRVLAKGYDIPRLISKIYLPRGIVVPLFCNTSIIMALMNVCRWIRRVSSTKFDLELLLVGGA